MSTTAIYPILLTPGDDEAMATLEWMRGHEPLPKLLVNVRVALEYAIGRGALMAALSEEASADE